ncbi:hypothetical protein LTR08_002640 [Meristemomyces frigidus]|nr:hypothetical protein LTR08_002640 [Meristemomyces frigidus]
MPNSSPKEKLSKLFHRHDHGSKKDEVPSSPPAASASSNRGLRQSSSRTSLRDVIHNRGRSVSKPAEQLRSPIDSGKAPQPIASTSPVYPPAAGTRSPAQFAAVRAMYPDEELLSNRSGGNTQPDEGYNYLSPRVTSSEADKLPDVRHESDLSHDLRHMTTSDAGVEPYSEDVADRNLNKRKTVTQSTMRPSSEQTNRPVGGYSEDVAPNDRSVGSNARGAPAPLNFKKRATGDSRGVRFGEPASAAASANGHSLARRSDVSDLRVSSDADRLGNASSYSQRGSLDATRNPKSSLRRSSLQKPLPTVPSDARATTHEGARAISNELPDVHSALGKERGYLVKDAEKPVNLSGIVDLRNTEDTTLHEKWAPAVTHSTIIRDEHHIREELITREIHNHHIFHRVLPIIDIEVLPARHFVPVDGGYAEIAEEEVPGQAGVNAQWIIAETMSKLMPESKGPVIPQQFTARKFSGTDGDYTESIAPEGHKRTEQWWVHPPTIEEGGKRTGQTYAFHIGSPDPRDDGLRAHLPTGSVIGVSPLLAKQQRKRLRMESEGGGVAADTVDEVPPPVPGHKLFPAELVDKSRAGQTRPHIAHGFSFAQ